MAEGDSISTFLPNVNTNELFNFLNGETGSLTDLFGNTSMGDSLGMTLKKYFLDVSKVV
jgi:hypothetical protein